MKRHGKPKLSAEYIRSILDYDPLTGILRWKPRTPDMFRETRGRSREKKCAQWNGRNAGKAAGTPANGYLSVSIFKDRYRAHRLGYLIVTGVWPTDQLDHRNLDRSDNRFENLREANNSQNNANRPIRRDNTSGRKGVYWSKDKGRWATEIRVMGRKRHLGYFDNIDDAESAYKAATIRFFGAFSRTGDESKRYSR